MPRAWMLLRSIDVSKLCFLAAATANFACIFSGMEGRESIHKCFGSQSRKKGTTIPQDCSNKNLVATFCYSAATFFCSDIKANVFLEVSRCLGHFAPNSMQLLAPTFRNARAAVAPKRIQCAAVSSSHEEFEFAMSRQRQTIGKAKPEL